MKQTYQTNKKEYQTQKTKTGGKDQDRTQEGKQESEGGREQIRTKGEKSRSKYKINSIQQRGREGRRILKGMKKKKSKGVKGE